MSTTSSRRLALVTAGRSDFGLIRPIANAVRAHENLILELVATGNHFFPRYGMTIDSVRAEFPAVQELNVFPDSTLPVEVGVGLGRLTEALSRLFAMRRPDWIIVLGDRIEQLAPAQAALLHGIPIAHVGGGETTLGAIDQQIRTCLTALATLHFVSIPEFAEQVIRQGGTPSRVFIVGETALDTLLQQPRLTDLDLIAEFGFLPDHGTLLVTFHPETKSPDFGIETCNHLLEAMRNPTLDGHHILVTMPNSDPGADQIIAALESFVAEVPQFRHMVPSLGSRIWAELLRRVGALVGNSSSGFLEAPSFCLPVVNVGDRQLGRMKVGNVISVKGGPKQVYEGLQKGLSPVFRDSLCLLKNIFGDGHSGARIIDILSEFIARQQGVSVPETDENKA